ncbi:MAG: hypothetical protein HRU12_17820 [Phaeodactylibacter sp.]|nr:hypothetical protein [Phaeodactylibacter sp.]
MNQVYYSEYSALMDFSYQSTSSLKFVLAGFERFTVLGQLQNTYANLSQLYYNFEKRNAP